MRRFKLAHAEIGRLWVRLEDDCSADRRDKVKKAHKFMEEQRKWSLNRLKAVRDNHLEPAGISTAQEEAIPKRRATAADLPPELFPDIVQWDVISDEKLASDLASKRKRKRQYGRLCLTCKVWAQVYRQKVWEDIALLSREDICAFSRILLTSPPAQLPPIWTYVKELWVVAGYSFQQPWLHLVPLVLRNPLFSRTPSLKYRRVLIEQDGDDKKAWSLKHHTQKLIPRAIPAWNCRCKRLYLSSVQFPSVLQPLNVLQEPGGLEIVDLNNVSWTTQPHYSFYVKPICPRLREVRLTKSELTAESCTQQYWLAWVVSRCVSTTVDSLQLTPHETELAFRASTVLFTRDSKREAQSLVFRVQRYDDKKGHKGERFSLLFTAGHVHEFTIDCP